jgi:hypothetical protein
MITPASANPLLLALPLFAAARPRWPKMIPGMQVMPKRRDDNDKTKDVIPIQLSDVFAA